MTAIRHRRPVTAADVAAAAGKRLAELFGVETAGVVPLAVADEVARLALGPPAGPEADAIRARLADYLALRQRQAELARDPPADVDHPRHWPPAGGATPARR